MTQQTSDIPIASHREKVIIPRIYELPWQPLLLEGGIRGPAIKVLSKGTGGALSPDPDFPVVTWISHLPPGWCDPELVYHPCVEESFVLGGAGYLADRYREAGYYLYRPPGILHGPAYNPPYTARTLLQRFGAGTDTLLRYEGDELPLIDCQAVTSEHEIWPVTWVEQLDSNSIPWQEIGSGPWRGASHKWLSRNKVTGGGTILIDIPAGWSGLGSTARGGIEELVVEGELSMGGQWFERWGYACRPAGDPADGYQALGGARLICFWDENELEA